MALSPSLERGRRPGPDGPGRPPGARPFLRRPDLLIPAVLAPVVETAVLATVGPTGSAPMGAQASAPPPLGLFHDLRWVALYHDTWWLLALELAAVLALRSLFAAWMVQRCWPVRPVPSLRGAFWRVAAFDAVAVPLLFPWVALLFGLAITHVSYLFFVAFPAAVAIALVLSRGAVEQAAGGWWRWTPTRASVLWVLAAVGWLTAAGAVIAVAPLPVGLLAAALAGLLNARALDAVVRSTVARASRRVAPGWVVPVALATTLAVVAGGAGAGFALQRPRPVSPRAIPIPASASGHPVLVAEGFNSRWEGGTRLRFPRGFVGWQFSYAGMRDGRLLPYGPTATLQALETSAARMAQQVNALHRAYGAPVAIVADSEGALVARTYLLTRYRPASHAVSRVVLLSMPVVVPGYTYPPAGRQGWGLAPGWTLRGIAWLIRRIGPLEFNVDAPFFRSLVECPDLTRGISFSPPPAGVQEVDVQSLADGVLDPSPQGLPHAADLVVAAPHGQVLHRQGVDRLIGGILLGRRTAGRFGVQPGLMRVIAAASAAWQVPSLALPGAVVGSRGCPTTSTGAG